ncbi:hypothetical protein FRACA_4270001 [Frankia canadensis]|uniref:Uncharacterized protein n=1 Tax=Frankia canadensis TaxID=1836972 RepID=A0A2I2KX65_9ACTN|nr:hypothetical protein FRACA_4270001 [Frankia canadensis]SOU57537.1 hypothetical protein FRACA_4270001 [Frankia canadensis]
MYDLDADDHRALAGRGNFQRYFLFVVLLDFRIFHDRLMA